MLVLCVLGSGLICAILGTVLGVLVGGVVGGLITAVLAGLAFVFCAVGSAFGPLGLAIAMVVAWAGGGPVYWLLLAGRRSALALGVAWFGFWGLFVFGYSAAGYVGVLSVTVPCLLLFWASVIILAGWYLLPVRDKTQRRDAIRSVLTFSLGTNYPYYVVEDREPVERVPGNPYGQFFAGPGIVLTGCDHAVAIWNGLAFRRVPDPGLAFTHQFESIQACIDLRPQLRSFDVVARTRDGIAIKVRTFVPFQIEGGDRVPELGSSFAFFRSSVFRAVHGRRVELGRVGAGNDEIEARQPRAWDDLVVTYACRILHNIISGIAFDELCEPIEASPHASASAGRPLDPDRGPRAEIAQALRSQLQEAVAPSGIRLLGGGISNLLPVEEAPMRGRVDNWLVEWTRLMIARLGEGEAKALETMEKARIEASAELVRRVGKKLEVIGGSSGRVSDAAVAIRFIEAVEEMASNPLVGRALSEGTRETLRLVAAAVGEDRGMGEAQGVGQP